MMGCDDNFDCFNAGTLLILWYMNYLLSIVWSKIYTLILFRAIHARISLYEFCKILIGMYRLRSNRFLVPGSDDIIFKISQLSMPCDIIFTSNQPGEPPAEIFQVLLRHWCWNLRSVTIIRYHVNYGNSLEELKITTCGY